MMCPNCNKTQLVITKGYYYCPSCKIYIGQVATYKPSTSIIEKPIVDRSSFVRLYISRALVSLGIILIIFYFTHDLFYLNISKGCYIFITPSINLEFSNAGVKRALKIIKNISPNNYQNICERVNFINTNISCGGFEGGCFEHNQPRTIFVTAPSRNITWVAEVLAHEACHARQMYEKRPGDEQECHQVGLKVMQDLTIY